MIDMVVCKDWKVWEPKGGREAGRKFYIKTVYKPKESGVGLHDIIKSSIRNNKVYMHKSTITDYQFTNNCRDLNAAEFENVSILDYKYDEYKTHWINMRIKKKAKRMLLE